MFKIYCDQTASGGKDYCVCEQLRVNLAFASTHSVGFFLPGATQQLIVNELTLWSLLLILIYKKIICKFIFTHIQTHELYIYENTYFGIILNVPFLIVLPILLNEEMMVLFFFLFEFISLPKVGPYFAHGAYFSCMRMRSKIVKIHRDPYGLYSCGYFLDPTGNTKRYVQGGLT